MSTVDWSQADYAPTLAEATRDEYDLAQDMCLAHEPCDVATTCDGCDQPICPNHSTDFIECAGNPNTLHHDDCRFDCIECVGAGAEDALAGA